MAYKLKIKRRDNPGQIIVKSDPIFKIIEGDKAILKGLTPQERLYEFFANLNPSEVEKISDISFLKQIINWAPQGGIALTEAAKWMPLAKRVNNLNEDKEGTLTLSQWQVDLIWSRLTNSEYKVALTPQFTDFILEFQELTGKHFPEEDPGDEDTPKKE